MKLKEKTLSSQQVFQGYWIRVQRDHVQMPSGRESYREYIHHSGAALVVAEPTPKTVIFVQQYRHPVKRIMWELPAGKRDPGESLLAVAKRELREETGFTGKKWKHLGYIYPCIGYADERIDIFHTKDLKFVGHSPDTDELLVVHELTWKQVGKLVRSGQITDAKTLSALVHFTHKF